MPLPKRTVALVASAIALFVGQVAGADGRLDSGVRGRVLYGPTCPVERAGETCVKPYRAALRILDQRTRTVVARTRSGADGRFSVRLSPGRYLIDPVSGGRYPRASSERVRVRRHRFARVTIMFDSGIR